MRTLEGRAIAKRPRKGRRLRMGRRLSKRSAHGLVNQPQSTGPVLAAVLDGAAELKVFPARRRGGRRLHVSGTYTWFI